MQDHIDGHVLVRHLDGPQDRLGIVDVDIAHQRETEQAQCFLPVDQRDDPALALPFQGIQIPSLRVEKYLKPTAEAYIDIPAQELGTRMPFSCSMGMFSGMIVFDL